VDGEQLLAQVTGITGKQPVQVVTVVITQPEGKGLELERLGIIVTAG
jgi:hypothetical protein